MAETPLFTSFNPEQRPEPGRALSVRNLSKSYDGVEILHGISADISAGELTLVKGESGSGKSTFIKCITGLESIDQGEVVCGDFALHEFDIDDNLADVRRQMFGYVFQSPNLQEGLSVEENIRFPYEIEGIELDDEWIRYVCEQVGIIDKLTEKCAPQKLNTSWLKSIIRGNHHIGQKSNSLSGGEQQRVAIARALAHKPRILVADEPTASLDTTNKERVHNVFRSLVDEGVTVVLVSHDSISTDYADQTITLQDGMIVGHATSSKLSPLKQH